MLKGFFHIIKWLVLALLAAVTCYLLAAVLLTVIPANASFKQPESGVAIFIISNGKHTDICLPAANGRMNWYDLIDTGQFEPAEHAFSHIAFGWGDKGFYLETPAWEDLKFSTAAKATLWPTPTAMHVTYYEHTPLLDELTAYVVINEEQYTRLVNFITSYFTLDDAGNPVLIDCCRYANINDNFLKLQAVFTCSRRATCGPTNASKQPE